MHVRTVSSMTAVLSLIAVLCVGRPPDAGAIVFSVDSTAEAHDATPGDGACDVGTGDCSLRAAIEEANALRGHDTVVVPAGTYVLSYPGGGGPTSATLIIMDDLDLLGAGAGATVIDGAGLYRVLHVWLNATRHGLPRSRVVIRDLTIANGNGVTGPNSGIHAGGILNQAILTLERCIVRNHAADLGGAIVNLDSVGPVRHPRLTMIDTEVRDNTTHTNGAGMTIPARCRVTIDGSIFSGNHADGPTSYGGAISTGRKGDLRVTGSQFTGNSSGNGGGALSLAGTSRIEDSVISGNTTRGNGGGIFRSPSEDEADAYYNPGPLTLTDTVITGNRADSDDTGSQFGGGVMSGSPGLSRVNTTISGNFGTGGAPDDCTCFK